MEKKEKEESATSSKVLVADLYLPVLTWHLALCIHTGTLEPLAGLSALQSLTIRSCDKLTGKWLPLIMALSLRGEG